MANLNIPFLLLQPSLCEFHPSTSTTKLIPYHKYNFKNQLSGIRHHQGSGIHHSSSGNHLVPQNGIAHGGNHSSFGVPNIQQSLHPSSIQNHQYELGKFSTFEDTPKNLVVMGDSKSGSLALFHQEHYISTKKNDLGASLAVHGNKQKSVTKFINSLVPRVLLVPSISEESGPLLDYALVRSPAPNILSTSTHFLITLHSDNRLRLWNTNDGRCVMVSQRDMLVTKAIRLQDIKSHPGNVLVIGSNKDIYVVNVYKMIIYKHFQYEIEGCVGSSFINKQLVICDQRGKVYVWKDESEASPIKNINSNNMYELSSHQDDCETFTYTLDSVVGEEEDLPSNKILAYNFTTTEQIFVISEHRVDFYMQKTRKTLFKFENDNKLVFAKFVSVTEREMLILIDCALNIYLFDLTKLRHEALNQQHLKLSPRDLSMLKNYNLIENSRFFDHQLAKHEDHHNIFNQQEEQRREFLDQIRSDLIKQINKQTQNKKQDEKQEVEVNIKDQKDQKDKIVNKVEDKIEQQIQQERVFRYSKVENMLYCVIEIDGLPKMISWSLETAFENLNYTQELTRDFQIPLFVNNIQLFQQQVQSCPINFYSLVIKNIYNKHQFQFFFSDETVTDSVIYTSMDNPSFIIGTSYGRIFMVPMFQESDEKIYPVILIDQHHQSPITQLYIAYDSSRRVKTSLRSASVIGKDHLQEQGGHLISTSEDGTIAVTNLNSGEIQKALATFTLQDRAKSRADQFVNEVNENRSSKRRHSITQCFQMNQFYHLVRVKSQSVYDYCSFGKIEKIIEVKSIIKLQERVVNQKQQQNMQNYDKKGDDDLMFQGINYQGEINSHPQTVYACISEDGMVMVLQISNLTCSLTTLHGLDSKAIGVYLNQELSHLYVLTQTLNIFVYSKKSLVLERRADFKYAMSVLYMREAVEYLLSKNESVRLACNNSSSGDSGVFEYETFEKVFRRKSLLMMGQGSHKILDFLSLSLNLPLLYHPHSIYHSSPKYTKSMHDLLSQHRDLTDFSQKEEAQKLILRVMNDCFFMNNTLYKSDFNEEYFQRQSGVSVVQTQQTVLGSKQQLIIANTKQMINLMKHKMMKIKSQKSGQQQMMGGAGTGNGARLQTQIAQSKQ